MRINRFDYMDLKTGWHLADAKFDDFNLLVGISGVGKTKILQALMAQRDLALAPKLGDAVSWDIEFESHGIEYRWAGRSEYADQDDIVELSEGG